METVNNLGVQITVQKQFEEKEYRKKKEALDAIAKRQQEREREIEERDRQRDGNNF